MLNALFHDMIGQIILGGAAFAVGLCLGSFASAIADRTRKGMSWIARSNGTPARSECPSCHHQLSALDLLPVVSWLMLKGRCRYCARPIGWIYPFIEIMGATSMMMIVLTKGFTALTLVMALCLPFALAGLLLSVLKEKAPLYMHIALIMVFMGSFSGLNPWVLATLYLIIGFGYTYMKKIKLEVGFPQVIFFAFWMNLSQVFCQMFTFRL